MTVAPSAIGTEADARPPRPGWAKALGISHLAVATVVSLIMLLSLLWVLILLSARPVAGQPSAMMGMDHPGYLWFLVVDTLTGLVGNGFTFASGVALLNLRPWGARVWRWLAPAKVARLVAVWGFFIVGVAPGLAAAMGRAVAAMMEQQAQGRGKLPTAGEMSLIYAWAFLAMGIGMMVLGSIYPAATWWLVGRPGLRLALVEPAPGPTDRATSTAIREVDPS